MLRLARHAALFLALLMLVGSSSRALGQVRVVDRLETDSDTAVVKPNLRIRPGDTIYLAEPLTSGVDVQITVEAFTGSTVEDREVVTLSAVNPGTNDDAAGFITTARRVDGGGAMAQAGDGTLQVRARNSIRFISASTGTGPDTTLVAEPAQVGLVTGSEEVTAFRIGDRIVIKVVDDDRNQDPSVAEVLPPALLNIRDTSNGTRDETPVLTETGPDTGVFIGSFPTAFVSSVAAATALNQIFEKTATTPVEITYTDLEIPSPSAVADPLIVRSIPLAVGVPGVTVGAASPLVVGQPIQLTVVDPNVNPQATGEGQDGEPPVQSVTVVVQARNASNVVVDTETVVLGTAGTTTFRGTVPWAFGGTGAENGTVNVPAGGTVTLAYVTPLGTNGQPFQSVTPSNPTVPSAGAGSISFVTGADGVTALPGGQLVTPGDTVFVRVVDPALVTLATPGTNSVVVTVNASAHSNPQTVVAHELGSSPGTFVAAVPTRQGDPLQSGLNLAPSGTLHVRGNDLITASYTDGGSVVRAATNTPRVAVNGAVVLQADAGSSNLPGASGEIRRIRAGESFLAVVRDDDRNASPAARDTLTVVVNVPGVGESESFTLTETDVDTGVFVARVQTAFDLAPNPAAGVVSVNAVAAANAINVEYVDPAAPSVPTAPNVAPNRFLAFLDVEGGVDGVVVATPASIGPGQRLNVSVTDTDGGANRQAGASNDGVRVTVIVSSGLTRTDSEVFDVPETTTAGAFAVAIETAFDYSGAPGTQGDGVVTVSPGCTIEVLYADAIRANGQANATVRITGLSAAPRVLPGLPSVAFSTPGPIDAGDTVALEVNDPNANVTEGTDSLTVSVQTGNGGTNQDVETVMLRETSPASGRFTGTFVTRAGAAAVGNGQLEVRGTGVTPSLTAVYDPAPAGGPLTSSAALSVRPGGDGTIALSAGPITPGAAVTITVTDTDRSANAHTGGGNDQVHVTLTSRDAANTVIDEEAVDVGETGTAGTFSIKQSTSYAFTTARAGTLAANQNDGVLTVVKDGTVRATYSDSLRANGDADAAVTSGDVPVGVLSATPVLAFRDNIEGGLPLETIEPGDIVFVRVEDANGNVTGGRDTVTVALTTGNVNGDQETLTLSETGATSGVFTGFIRTKLGANEAIPGLDVQVVRGNGQLEVRGRDAISGTYASASVFPTAPVTPVQVHTNGVIRFVQFAGSSTPPSERFLRAGDPVFVQVVDDDLNVTNGPDKVTVVVRSRDAAGNSFDTVQLELVETGGSTGVFGIAPGARADTIAAIGEVSGGHQSGLRTEDRPDRVAVPNDGILQVVGSARVTAELSDAARPAGLGVLRTAEELVVRPVVGTSAEARIRILPPGVGIQATATEVAGGEQFSVEVTDANANRTARVDTVSIIAQVTQASGGAPLDSESMQLTETGGDTGVFVGAISTNFGPRLMNNAALTVQGGETITVNYNVLTRDGGPSVISQKVLVTNQYSTKRTVSNLAADGTALKLASGALFSVPANAVHRPVDLTFNQRFGKTDADASPIDPSGNVVPPPLNPQVRLTRVAGRPFWFDIQPEGMHFRKPAELSIPIPVDLQVVDPVTGQVRAVTEAEKNNSLKIVYFDGMDWLPVGGRFVAQGAGPDPGQAFVTASVNHLSMYALAIDTRPPPFVGGPLISEVTLDNTTFTPNGDGANDATTLSFGLAEASTVTVRIFDGSGEMVRTLIQDASFAAGFGSTQWDGSYQFATRKVPAGIYVFEIKATTVSGSRSSRESIIVGVMK